MTGSGLNSGIPDFSGVFSSQLDLLSVFLSQPESQPLSKIRLVTFANKSLLLLTEKTTSKIPQGSRMER
jgi:hypothetical protein